MRQFLAIAALVATGLLPGQDYVQAQGADTVRIDRPAVEVAPDRTQLSAALRTAIRESFPQRDVRIRLAGLDIDPAGPAQREVHARGRILLDDAGDWIGFDAVALYDLETGRATTTALQMQAPRDITFEVDAKLAAELNAEATRRLRAEFASQPASIELADVQSRSAGDLMALVADGSAHFGTEGSTQATVRALYDPRSGQWLRLDYELGYGGLGDGG